MIRNNTKPDWGARICMTVLGIFLSVAVLAQASQSPPVSMGADGTLVYQKDSLGNRIPDFSYAGYMASAQPIPDVPVRVRVPVRKGDATYRIQAALDYVAALPADDRGIRGAVLLEDGIYEVHGSLQLNASGVVLRGSGMEENGTVLLGAGTGRQTLITIAGKNDREIEFSTAIKDAYVPVNATVFRVADPERFQVGDRVLVRRPSTEKWIEKLGMSEFGGETGWLGWKPGERDLYWDREIIGIRGDRITIDAPLTTALDSAYGGGMVEKYQWQGRIRQVGVENLLCRSAYDERNPKDEAHRWMAITLENVQDAWVRRITFRHFAGSAVAAWETASRITVEDCKSLDPVSEIGGQRRYTFFTSGQQCLFQRLYAENGYHDFAVGFRASGPNAFVQCESHLPHSFSGAIDSWASGVLFDIVNVDGHMLSFSNRGQDAQGAGWTAANSMFWQCAAAKIECFAPPTAQNWAFGAWSQFAGNGYWYEANSHVKPRSLFYQQLADRLGREVLDRAHLLPHDKEPTSSPTVEQAAELTALSDEPALRLEEWISRLVSGYSTPAPHKKTKTIDQLKNINEPRPSAVPSETVQVRNGWLVTDHAVLTGKRLNVQWWRGNVRYYDAAKARPHVTRFVPGRTGLGLTDNLSQTADWMVDRHVVALEHNYGLWYDRRRDDHQRVRRMDGEVWPPFYELPFARSGIGTAWDGLSKYDLTKYNSWYWNRLKQFAELADQKGLMLIHQQYFQHNILEAGGHYADFPWRTANNINDTGFPEPPPYAGDKRIFMAELFYDVDHPQRRKLHEAYIRQCLDNFSGSSNVLQLISAEYTGPLHFVQFWTDVILDWQAETGKDALIGLSTTKDVQDAILADPRRAAAIDVIDIRYWHYGEDDQLYAPKGGQNMAPRQHARKMKQPKETFAAVYRAVSEYRKKFPGKAVIYSTNRHEAFFWAVFMAGGSMAAIPPVEDQEFLAAAAGMQPVRLPDDPAGQWALGNMQKEYIVYGEQTAHSQMKLDLSGTEGRFRISWFDPESGRLLTKPAYIKGGRAVELTPPQATSWVVWIDKQ